MVLYVALFMYVHKLVYEWTQYTYFVNGINTVFTKLGEESLVNNATMVCIFYNRYHYLLHQSVQYVVRSVSLA